MKVTMEEACFYCGRGQGTYTEQEVPDSYYEDPPKKAYAVTTIQPCPECLKIFQKMEIPHVVLLGYKEDTPYYVPEDGTPTGNWTIVSLKTLQHMGLGETHGAASAMLMLHTQLEHCENTAFLKVPDRMVELVKELRDTLLKVEDAYISNCPPDTWKKLQATAARLDAMPDAVAHMVMATDTIN